MEIRLSKMSTLFREGAPVLYFLEDEGRRVCLNHLLGQKISLRYEGLIHCLNCGRETYKSFAQGYCFGCMNSLASCDQCMMRPELCHYHLNTCREPEWGETYCMTQHVVYLANSSGIKVGITRQTPPVNRWIDQGAVAGIAVLATRTRLEAGRAEVLLKKHIPDRTHWRRMLAGEPESLDLEAEAKKMLTLLPEDHDFTWVAPKPVHIQYPVLEYPQKVKTLSLDKTPLVEGTLLGVKGQYLLLDTGAFNVRKHGGYGVTLKTESVDLSGVELVAGARETSTPGLSR